ncbi:hypothetical protein IUU84_08115 [Kocuria rhizophila]|uniref:hypothetical protein n=1 Tax=Kocuria rhizophila TaxID=72000 RepID=UPI00294A4110|nr:hypothetical protein [Kocuria rhizophila]MDV5999536.1 hypothetical protein [Kocuria rhizophila]
MNYDPQALANAETYLINFLEHSTPPRQADLFEITEAARDYHDTTGNWELGGAGRDAIEELLARHAK